MAIQKLRQARRKAGFRGMIKSAVSSMKHTRRPDSLLFHTNTITDIDESTQFEISNRIEVGIGDRGATHPRIGRSKFESHSGSTVARTGNHRANIGPASIVHIEGDFRMGDSNMNSHGRILCGNEITIGDGCELSWDVQLLDDDRHKLSINGTEQPRSGPIHIGDNVWIGQGVTVLKGVSIGDGSVIGASSVVSKDIPPQSLAVGQPANVVREDVAWS